MNSLAMVEEYLNPLLAGDRAGCRAVIQSKLAEDPDATRLYRELLWPAVERIEKLHRTDRINIAVEQMATRINRAIADQLQVHLPKQPLNGKKILITCADDEPEELGAQMCSDLFESRGWRVYFVGGGAPNDEILGLVGRLCPDFLLIFGTQPGGVPGIRRLVDMIREIGVNPTMNIMVSGGVFNRADGLWKEVSADLIAKTADQALELAETAPPRTPVPPKPTGVKKRRRRRREPAMAGADE